MTTNATRFIADLEREAKELTDGQFRNFRDKLMFEALGLIDSNWPVKTGHSRNGNLPFRGSPDVRVPEEGEGSGVKEGDPPTAEKLEETRLTLQGGNPYETVGIASNVDYAPFIESSHPKHSHAYANAAAALKNRLQR